MRQIDTMKKHDGSKTMDSNRLTFLRKPFLGEIYLSQF